MFKCMVNKQGAYFQGAERHEVGALRVDVRERQRTLERLTFLHIYHVGQGELEVNKFMGNQQTFFIQSICVMNCY